MASTENLQFCAVCLVEEFGALKRMTPLAHLSTRKFLIRSFFTLITIGSTSATTEETNNEAAAMTLEVMLKPFILQQ